MTFLLPDKKAYCGAEILGQTMHNLLPVRGAKARDSLRWANDLDQALEQTADADVFFATHNWPIWGRAHITEFITKHRDVYKYTHDQTVRLINAGYTPREIADMIKLPKSLESYLNSRGYYGDLRHNVKAVYQFYMGFYDGNPANLNPLPPEESAKRYIELAGGADKAIAAAQAALYKVTIVGRLNCLITLCSPSPTTKVPATYLRALTTRWATWPKQAPGATVI